MSVVPVSAALVRRPVDAIRMRWRKLIAAARTPYRPELHYMRGPGPKWHAKHISQSARILNGSG